MGKYIGIFNDSVNDIEINGFALMTDKEVEEFEELALSITWPFTYKLGDEELEFNSGDDLLTRIDFKVITIDEYKTILKLFGTEYGVFIDEFYLREIVINDSDDELDEDGDESVYDDDYDDNYDDY